MLREEHLNCFCFPGGRVHDIWKSIWHCNSSINIIIAGSDDIGKSKFWEIKQDFEILINSLNNVGIEDSIIVSIIPRIQESNDWWRTAVEINAWLKQYCSTTSRVYFLDVWDMLCYSPHYFSWDLTDEGKRYLCRFLIEACQRLLNNKKNNVNTSFF